MRKLYILSPVANQRHHLNQLTIEALSARYDTRLVSVHGQSEVSRARNDVATKAYRDVVRDVMEGEGLERALVFWLDADMVLPNMKTFERHVQAVDDTGRAISGRYVRRQLDAPAASSDDTRSSLFHDGWHLDPVLSGMGCLLMSARMFTTHVESSPFGGDGVQESFFVCAPRVLPHSKFGWVMVSEDHDYCNALTRFGGVWYATDSEGNGIDYGHMGERVLLPDPGRHKPST